MSATPANRNTSERNAEATVHVAHLDEKVTDALLWELMVQAGPVRHVYIPRNRITGAHFGYGFCEFLTPLDAFYATKVLNSINLFSKPIRISQSTVDRVSQDVGANLFIGNLVEEVDEKLLHDAFSAFGPLIDAPYIMRDLPNPKARRYGFVKYSRFDHSDAAISAMNGQYICNHPIIVQYAFKKDSDSRERHGSEAERILAARALQASKSNSLAERLRPNTRFSDKPAKRARPAVHLNSNPVNSVPQAYNYPASSNSIPIVFPQMPYTPSPMVPPWQHAVPNSLRPDQLPPFQPNNMPIPPSFAPYHPNPTLDIGWSHGRRFGSRPPQTMPPYASPRYPPASTAIPIDDEQAPPPPSSNRGPLSAN